MRWNPWWEKCCLRTSLLCPPHFREDVDNCLFNLGAIAYWGREVLNRACFSILRLRTKSRWYLNVDAAASIFVHSVLILFFYASTASTLFLWFWEWKRLLFGMKINDCQRSLGPMKPPPNQRKYSSYYIAFVAPKFEATFVPYSQKLAKQFRIGLCFIGLQYWVWKGNRRMGIEYESIWRLQWLQIGNPNELQRKRIIWKHPDSWIGAYIDTKHSQSSSRDHHQRNQ